MAARCRGLPSDGGGRTNDLTLRIDSAAVGVPARRPAVRRPDGRRSRSRGRRPTEQNLARYPVVGGHRQRSRRRASSSCRFDLKRPSAMLPEDLTVPLGCRPGRRWDRPVPTIVQDRTHQTVDARSDSTGTTLASRRSTASSSGRSTRFEPAGRACCVANWTCVYDVPADAVEFIRNDDVRGDIVPALVPVHARVQLAHDGVLKSPLVRKALNMAMDRDGIVKKVLHGAGEASSGPIYPKYWAYDSTQCAVSSTILRRRRRCWTPPVIRFPRRPTRTARGAVPFHLSGPAEFRGLGTRRARNPDGICSTSASTCSSRSVPFTEFNELARQRASSMRCSCDMISGPTPARPYIWWRSATTLQGCLQRVRLRKRRGGTAVRESCSARRTKRRSGRPRQSCSGSFTRTRPRYSSRGTRARARSAGASQLPDDRPRSAVDAVAVDARIDPSGSWPGEEDLDTLRADDGGRRGRAAARLRSRVDLCRCATARSRRSSTATRTSPGVSASRSSCTSQQHPHPERRRRRPAADRPRAVAAGPHPQELRPATFREFKELTLLDDERASRRHPADSSSPTTELPGPDSLTIDRRPDLALHHRRRPAADGRRRDPADRKALSGGWLVGRLRLEELWRTVDGIRVGETGYALVVTNDGQLLAHGDPESKSLVARARQPERPPGRGQAMRRPTAPGESVVSERVPGRRRRACSASAPGCRRSAGRSSSNSRRARRSPSPTSLQQQLVICDRASRCSRCCSSARSGAGASSSRSSGSPAARARWPRGDSTRASPSLERRARAARHRLQQHGRQARRAAGGRAQERAAGDVRPHRHRPGARPLAPDSEHRQRLQADAEDVGRPGVPRELQADHRARAGADQARARRPAQRRQADAARALPASTSTRRWPTWSSR